MYFQKTSCRACGYAYKGPQGIKALQSENLIEVFDLGIQPLANDFKNECDEHSGYAPLKVMFCPMCTLAQLSTVVKPEILYSDYPYVTSKSKTMRDHFGSLWSEILKENQVESILEIGSNDGDFLQFAKEHGAKKVIGIDPAQNLADLAVERGITTICNVFNRHSAYSAALSVSQPDVIVARHVFCHADDWQEFIRGIDVLSGPETLTVIEVPYVMDLLKNVKFDTIYHEHLSYLSITAINHLLATTSFHLHKIVPFPVHGGAIALMIRRNNCGIEIDNSVSSFKENITVATWKEFAINAKAKISQLSAFVNDAVSQGKRVCGLGASAKSTVWINACGFKKQHINFICDCTPNKQYRFSPGSNIPVVDEGALLRDLPDICINFAWNFMDECLAKNQAYINYGGQIVSPYLT